MSGLQSLDLSSSPLSEKEGYVEKVFEMFPSLEVLDGLNKEGDEVLSEDEDDEDYGLQEEGEADGEGGALLADDDEYGEEDLDEYGDDDDYGSDDGEEGGDQENGAPSKRKRED